MKWLLSLVLVIAWSILPTPVFAHLAGQPPFFKIDNVYTELYSVPTTSLNNFNLPQDLAVNPYLVNQSLHMELVEKILPAPPEIIAKTKFYWDFGDGSKAEGLQNTHTYTKAGSYFLTIHAQYETDPAPQLLQSALINIIPHKGYKLPKAAIQINGQYSKDPLTDIIKANFNQSITFDAGNSDSGEESITEYFWDLGNQQTSDKKKFSYQYPQKATQLFPVLRIKTSDGFIADSFVEIEHDEEAKAAPSSTFQQSSSYPWILLISVPIVGIALIGLRMGKKAKK